MQLDITLPMRAITAPPVSAICPTCHQVQRQGARSSEATWRNSIVMWGVALLAYGAGIMALVWVASTGVLAWL